MKVKSRFTKGQVIFQACPRFTDHNGQDCWGLVVARCVDACGAKRVTFFDHGNDFVFYRSWPANSPLLFDTHAAALDYLRARGVPNIDPRQHTDSLDVIATANELKSGGVPA